jgi:hypothetical protein
VSPLWIEHSAWLAGKRLTLASQPRLQKAEKVWLSQPIDQPSAAPVLQQLLAARPASSISTLKVLLSGEWVRYCVLPWQDGLYQPADWQAYARLMFAQQFGSSDGWRIAINPAGFGQNRLACAMDETTYLMLLELAKSQRCRLLSVEPLLSTVIKQHRRQLRAAEFALLISEPDSLCCAFWHSGAWQGVISLPLQKPDEEAIAALLRQAAMLAQVKLPAEVYLSSSAHALAKLSLPGCQYRYLGAVHPLFTMGVAA